VTQNNGDQISLRRLMHQYFNFAELKMLAYDLNVDQEEFGQALGKSEWIVAFIEYLRRHGRLDALLHELPLRRPGVDWPDDISAPEVLDEPASELLAGEIPLEYYEPETILIPAGAFLMGSPEGSDIPLYETPQHSVELPDYRIGKFPVTNEQYAVFVAQTGRLVEPALDWPGQAPSKKLERHPVSGVTWYEAMDYCLWLSEQTGRGYSLPNEAEWEKAARGVDGRTYPWGDVWQSDRCNHGAEETAPVDAFPQQSDYGCYDMVGNVREWTRSLWGENWREPDPEYRYPWRAEEKRSDPAAGGHIRRVYRGGSAADHITQLRCSARNAYAPDKAGPPGKRHGFRVLLAIDG
jgi:formylglycine-generating enzyme required for sulfatase activity